jgi:hypothetical protein
VNSAVWFPYPVGLHGALECQTTFDLGIGVAYSFGWLRG